MGRAGQEECGLGLKAEVYSAGTNSFRHRLQSSLQLNTEFFLEGNLSSELHGYSTRPFRFKERRVRVRIGIISTVFGTYHLLQSMGLYTACRK